MLLSIAMPSDNERGPQFAEQFFGAVHVRNRQREPVTLHYATRNQRHGLYLRSSQNLSPLVRDQLTAAYPNATIEKLDETALSRNADQQVCTVDLCLRPDLFSIRRAAEFEDLLTRERDDPLGGVLAALAADDPQVVCRIDLTITPAHPLCAHWYRHCVQLLQVTWLRPHNWLHDRFARGLSHRRRIVRGATWLALALLPGGKNVRITDEMSNPDHNQESDASGALDKVSRHLYQTRMRLYVFAPITTESEAERKLIELSAAFAPFVLPRRSVFEQGRISRVSKCPASQKTPTWLASSEELASLWHPATQSVGAVNMKSAAYRQLEPPANIPRTEEEGTAVLGRANTLHHKAEFGLKLDDRRRHLAVIGKTGMGKSTLLGSLITADIEAGRGVVLIDPHGDLAEQVVATIPRRRTGDVIYFDAGDRDYPLAFNPLSHRDGRRIGRDARRLIAYNMADAFDSTAANTGKTQSQCAVEIV